MAHAGHKTTPHSTSVAPLPGSPTGPWQGRRIAITGANGSLGRALIRALHRQGAQILALTSSAAGAGEPLVERDDAGAAIPLKQVNWRCGAEAELAAVLATVDVLVLNHGVNVLSARSAEATALSLEVNALSSWRLLELFAGLEPGRPASPAGGRAREVWVNTSEAEIQPALSPLYELSKRLLGQLLSLRALDLAGPGLRIRRLVLGPFRSALNPIGVMGADFVAREIVRQAGWNLGLVIVTPNPLTYVLMPVATLGRWLYFRLLTRLPADGS
ncbi:SDR family NAD(P)-dependent oxidoreductase [Synechococcus sp. GreenBA-s]|nr:SDR family NAD(P)-dependent oxidoreductase [Synechococcus sp. GreenBA-s]